MHGKINGLLNSRGKQKILTSDTQMFRGTHVLLCQEESCIMAADYFPEHYSHWAPLGSSDIKRTTASVLCPITANRSPFPCISAWWEIKGQQNTRPEQTPHWNPQNKAIQSTGLTNMNSWRTWHEDSDSICLKYGGVGSCLQPPWQSQSLNPFLDSGSDFTLAACNMPWQDY